MATKTDKEEVATPSDPTAAETTDTPDIPDYLKMSGEIITALYWYNKQILHVQGLSRRLFSVAMEHDQAVDQMKQDIEKEAIN